MRDFLSSLLIVLMATLVIYALVPSALP